MAKHSNSMSAITVGNNGPKSSNKGVDPSEVDDINSYVAFRKKKYNTRWKQQRNIAIRQDLTFFHILIFYVTLGIIFIAIAIVCYILADKIPPPLRLEYTNCKDTLGTRTSCAQVMREPGAKDKDCTCQLDFNISEALAKSKRLILYYELDNYYQNARSYKKDIDWDQLDGKASKGDCKYEYYNKPPGSPNYVYPCGKVANSYFSDTFEITDSSGNTIQWDETGIAWESDKNHVKNPSEKDLQNTMESKFAYPTDWHKELKASFWPNKGVENEHFIVWIRAAALKDFRKKYARLKRLAQGTYTLTVSYRYEVTSFDGKKWMVIRSNDEDVPIDFFFFYTYLIVGCVCVALGPVFFFVKCIFKTTHKPRSQSQAQMRRTDEEEAEEGLAQPSQTVSEGPSISNIPQSMESA